MKPIKLLYGRDSKFVQLPTKLKVNVLHPQELPVEKDIAAAVHSALTAPIDSKPLSVLAHGRRNPVILVSDLTRDVPDGIIVPLILDELNKAGVPDERITVIVALGAHRPITREEALERFGNDVLSRVRLINHNASDKDSLVHIGTSSFGNRIWINRLVAESDLVIGTGVILPHVIAGYGGGRKIVLPGVTGEETIAKNHSMTKGVGFCRLRGNTVHEEMVEAARMARLEFIINVVWNGEGDLVKVVAGEMEAAWKYGVDVAARIYTASVESPCDLLITSGGGAPTDINFYQAVRGLQVGLPVVRDGGVIILVAECTEGVGSTPLYTWLRDATAPEDVLRRVKEEGFKIHGEHIAAYLCEHVFPRVKVFLVSSLSNKIVEEMMMTPAGTVEEAVELAMKYLRQRTPSVIVNPYGAKVVLVPRWWDQ